MDNIKKFSPPTKFDQAPLGTIWESEQNESGVEIWVQLSEVPEEPKWERLGSFLERAFAHLCGVNKAFVLDCITLLKARSK
jgi:hypothetical protein